MALSIGVRRGSKVQIGGEQGDTLTVLEVLAPGRVRVRFKDREILVTSKEKAILSPQVSIQCGEDGEVFTGEHESRIAFHAHRSIPINRIPFKRRRRSER